jgi:hypothetical protein
MSYIAEDSLSNEIKKLQGVSIRPKTTGELDVKAMVGQLSQREGYNKTKRMMASIVDSLPSSSTNINTGLRPRAAPHRISPALSSLQLPIVIEKDNNIYDNDELTSQINFIGNNRLNHQKSESDLMNKNLLSRNRSKSNEYDNNNIIKKSHKIKGDISDLWASLSHFSKNNLGRTLDASGSVDNENIHFLNIAKDQQENNINNIKTNFSSSKFQNNQQSTFIQNNAFTATDLPVGDQLKFNILSTW